MKGSIRQRSAGSWELRWDAGRDPATGKRKTKSETFRGTKSEANKKLRAILSSIDAGTYVEPSKLTVREYLLDWHDQGCPCVKENIKRRTTTLEHYANVIHNHLLPALGNSRLADLRLKDIDRYLLDKDKAGLSVATRRLHFAVLNSALRFAASRGFVANNPCHLAKPPKEKTDDELVDDAGGDNERAPCLDENEVATLLSATRDSRLFAPTVLMLGTGIRRGECLALRLMDVDLNGTALWRDEDMTGVYIRVARTLVSIKASDTNGPKRTKLAFHPPKSKMGRRKIAISESTADALREHLRQQREERLKLGLGRASPKDLLFPSPDGSPWCPKRFQGHFCYVAKRAGLDVSPHILRHTHFSELAKKHVPPRVLQERAGHHDIAFTLRQYVHPKKSQDEAAAALLDAGLRAALGE